MARNIYDGISSSAETAAKENAEIISASDQGPIMLPNSDFVKDADIMRDGQDLVLESPDGSTIIIEGYFNALPAPTLFSPDGTALTPELVQSFAKQAGPLQYADSGNIASDESPVGSVQELSGNATVTRTNGATEPLTIGTPIFEGDIVETDASGAVNIVFIDESSFAVSNNARLAIDEYVFDPATESGATNVSMLRGVFMFTSGLIGRSDPDDVEIDTPMGSIGIRGTVIAGNTDTGEVTVLEGAIVMRGLNGKEITLSNQYDTGQFDSTTGDVQYKGAANQDNFDQDFSNIKSVSPGLFVGLENQNDAAENNNAENTQKSDPQADSKADSDSTDTNTETDANTDSDNTDRTDGTDDTLSLNEEDSGTTDAGFDEAAGTDDSTTDDTATFSTTTASTTTTSSDDSTTSGDNTESTTSSTSSDSTSPDVTQQNTDSTGDDGSSDPNAQPTVTLSDNGLTLAEDGNLIAGQTVSTLTMNSSGGPLPDDFTFANYTMTNSATTGGGDPIFELAAGGNLYEVNVILTAEGANYLNTAGTSENVSFDVDVSYDWNDTDYPDYNPGTTTSSAGTTYNYPLVDITTNSGPTIANDGSAAANDVVSVYDVTVNGTTDTLNFALSNAPETNNGDPVFNTSYDAGAGQVTLTLTSEGADYLNNIINDGTPVTLDTALEASYTWGGGVYDAQATGTTGAHDYYGPLPDTLTIQVNSVSAIDNEAAQGDLVMEVEVPENVLGATLNFAIDNIQVDSVTYSGADLFTITASGNTAQLHLTADGAAYLEAGQSFNIGISASITDALGTIADTGTVTDGFTVSDADLSPQIDTNTALDLSLLEGGEVAIDNNLSASDDGAAADIVYTLDTAPSYGDILLNGTALNTGESFSQADLDSGLVTYKPDTSLGDPASGQTDSFDFTLSDGVNTPVTDTFNLNFGMATDDTITITMNNSIAYGAGGIDDISINGASNDLDIFAGDGDDTVSFAANDVSIIDSNNINLLGGTGYDTLEFTGNNAFNITPDGANSRVESFEIYDFQNSLANTISAELTQNMLSSNTDSSLTILFDDSDTLSIAFENLSGTWSETAQTGNSVTYSDGTYSVTLQDQSGTALANATITGITAPSGPLDLNALSAANGFIISDDIAEQFAAGGASYGDYNNDGYDDFLIVKSDDATLTGGEVFLLDGQSGGYNSDSLTNHLGGSGLTGFGAGFFTGNADDISISSIGDFNGDGLADFIIGAPNADTDSATQTGQALIVDENGNEILRFDGFVSGDMAGTDVTGIGDINNDGYADILVGAPHAGGSLNGEAHIILGGANRSGVINVADMDGGAINTSSNADLTTREIFYDSASGKLLMFAESGIRAYEYDSATKSFANPQSSTGGTNDRVAMDISHDGSTTYMNIITSAGEFQQYTVTSSTMSAAGATTIASANNAIDMAVAGNTAYVLTSLGSVMQINDIHGTPTGGGYINNTNSTAIDGARQIVSDGTNVYVMFDGAGAGDSGLVKMNLADVGANLTTGDHILQNSTALDNAQDIVLDTANNRAYVISSNGTTGQLTVLDLSSSNNILATITNIDVAALASATELALKGNSLYLAADDGTNGHILTFDITQNQPHLMSHNTDASLRNIDDIIIEGSGAEQTAIFTTTDGQLVSYDMIKEGQTLSGGTSELLGSDVTDLGDFDGDGYSDFAISRPGTGNVDIMFGAKNGGPGSTLDSITISNIAVDTSDKEIPIFNMGDVNGDGQTDIAIAATDGSGQVGIFMGGHAGGDFSTADVMITPDASHEIIGGGNVGDFNADGYDDMVVVMQNTGTPTTVDIYVAYGAANLSGTIDNAYLNDTANAFHITYTIPNGADPANFDFEIYAAGDLNGDGFYDLGIGMPDVDNNSGTDSDGDSTADNDADGSLAIIYGRDAEGNIDLSGTSDIDSLTATGNSMLLNGGEGNDTLSDGGNSNTVFRGGAGADTITINNAGFLDIDGGGGHDTLSFGTSGSLDLSGLTNEKIARIEEVFISQNSSTLTLNLEDIFSLLESSDTGNLRIDYADTAGSTLTINTAEAGDNVTGADQDQLASMLGATEQVTSANGFYQFKIGGHSLEIDQNLIQGGNVDIA